MASRLTPVPVRLTPEQVRWLDSLICGPVSSRGEALRHVLADAMKRDQRRQRRQQQPTTAA